MYLKTQLPPLPTSLDALLPLLENGSTLAVDVRTRTLFKQNTASSFVEKFTPSELRLLLALYAAYPKGCSTEYLLSQLNMTSSLPTIQDRIETARRSRTVKQELRPLRVVLKNIRIKLSPFTLTIATVHVAEALITDAGYQLASLSLYDGEKKYVPSTQKSTS